MSFITSLPLTYPSFPCPNFPQPSECGPCDTDHIHPSTDSPTSNVALSSQDGQWTAPAFTYCTDTETGLTPVSTMQPPYSESLSSDNLSSTADIIPDLYPWSPFDPETIAVERLNARLSMDHTRYQEVLHAQHSLSDYSHLYYSQTLPESCPSLYTNVSSHPTPSYASTPLIDTSLLAPDASSECDTLFYSTSPNTSPDPSYITLTPPLTPTSTTSDLPNFSHDLYFASRSSFPSAYLTQTEIPHHPNIGVASADTGFSRGISPSFESHFSYDGYQAVSREPTHDSFIRCNSDDIDDLPLTSNADVGAQFFGGNTDLERDPSVSDDDFVCSTSDLEVRGPCAVPHSVDQSCAPDTCGGLSRSDSPVPIPNLTKKSRGRRVPTKPVVISEDGIEKNARTFVCTVRGCHKHFVRAEHLKRHVRCIHTNQRPHTCPHPGCGKVFSRNDNLGQHMRVHKNFKIFIHHTVPS